MHPRTLIIVIACILGSAIGARTLIDHADWFNPSETAILKRATCITVSYPDNGIQKTCSITTPSEVQELLALVRRPEPPGTYRRIPENLMTHVQFVFADGTIKEYRGLNSEIAMNQRFGAAFSQKLFEIVSRQAGKAVNFFPESDSKLP